VHQGIPLDWGFPAPAYWDEDRDTARGFLSPDYCAIPRDATAFDYFVRGVIEIPILDGETEDEESFGIGVWVSLSEQNFKWFIDRADADRDNQGTPWFGWLSNSIPVYPETLNLKTNVHLRGPDWRPSIQLQPSDHPLARDQHDGISLARARELSALWHHANEA
jgi:hypothetical protein